MKHPRRPSRISRQNRLFELLFTRLDLMSGPGNNKAMVRSVLKEGYSATELRLFVPEFRRKLERMNYVHGKIKGRRTSDIALRNFIQISRLEGKLSLARYKFTADEVAERILKQLKISDGLKDVDQTQPAFVR